MKILDKKPNARSNNFLNKIPGFRSNTRLNKIVAWSYYISMILSLIAVFGELDLMAMVLASFALPFVVAGIIDVIKNKQKIKSKYFLRKVVVPFVVMQCLVNLAVSLPSSASTDVSSGLSQQANEEISQSQASSEEKNELVTDAIDSSHTPEVEENIDNVQNVEIAEVKEAEIHFIDTGNSDAILIKQGDQAALIDGGDNDDEERIVSYLKSQGVSELEYVFATHPHADHIGGLDAVINQIPVKNVYVSNGDMDTKTYSDFITAMVNKGLSPSVPLLNSEYKLGTSTFKVLSVANESEPNNNSIVLLYTNGEDKILLMGDAEEEIEHSINPGHVDLLKVGHHGSSSSSTEFFISKVSPEYAVILVGENNKYGHPHTETMHTLKSHNIKVHRTDECGNIVFKSTGNGLEVDCKEASYESGSQKGSSETSSNSNNASSSTTSTHTSLNSNNTSSSQTSNSGTSSTSSHNTSNSGASSAPSSNTSNSGTSQSSQKVVYANGGSSKSNKYHSSPTAHNMEGSIKMTEDEAKSKGYVACKKCY